MNIELKELMGSRAQARAVEAAEIAMEINIGNKGNRISAYRKEGAREGI